MLYELARIILPVCCSHLKSIRITIREQAERMICVESPFSVTAHSAMMIHDGVENGFYPVTLIVLQ